MNAAAVRNCFAMAVLRLAPGSLGGHRGAAECGPQAIKPRVLPQRRGELGTPDEPAREGIFDGLLQLLLAHAPCCGVEKRPERCRHPETGSFLDIFRGEEGLVKDDTPGCALAERRRDREVHSVREEFGQVVKDECRLMRDDCLRDVLLVPAPEDEPDEVVVFCRGNGRETVQAVGNPLEIPGGLVVVGTFSMTTSAGGCPWTISVGTCAIVGVIP